MTFILYGIKNCDTVKKARKWLDDHRVEYRFHDFRADGIEPQQIQQWLDEIGIDMLINKRGTTYRHLNDEQRDQLASTRPADLLAAQPTLMKRPVLDLGHERVVGFSVERYHDMFKTHTL